MVFLVAAAHFALALIAVLIVNQIGLRAWRKTATAHWTDRARVLWPARVTAGSNLLLVPLLFVLIGVGFEAERPSSRWLNIVGAVSGGFLGGYAFDRAVFPGFRFVAWFHQSLAMLGIRLGALILVGTTCFLMPKDFGWPMFLLIIGYLLIHFAMHWGLVMQYLRWVKLLKPADKRLLEIVSRLVPHGSISVRHVWQLESVLALAFAIPTTRELIFSRRLLEIASDEEIQAIAAHEIAHLAESKLVLAGRLIGSLALSPLIFINPLCHLWGIGGLIIPIIITLLIAKLNRRLSLRMETRADTVAVKSQSDEGVYARALETIYRENLLPAVNAADRMTHPHLYDRLVAAGVTPEYDRPKKPKQLSFAGLLVYVALGVVIALALAKS